MAKKKRATRKRTEVPKLDEGCGNVLSEVVDLLESARHLSARSVNSIMTATYWEIGRRIVELEQGGKGRAKYGKELIPRLASDLTERFGRGFSQANLKYMRQFYEFWPIRQTVSDESDQAKISQTPSGKSGKEPTRQTASDQSEARQLIRQGDVQKIATAFPLPWSHYVKLLAVQDENARKFYEEEALKGGWSVRQLKRQIDSQTKREKAEYDTIHKSSDDTE